MIKLVETNQEFLRSITEAAAHDLDKNFSVKVMPMALPTILYVGLKHIIKDDVYDINENYVITHLQRDKYNQFGPQHLTVIRDVYFDKLNDAVNELREENHIVITPPEKVLDIVYVTLRSFVSEYKLPVNEIPFIAHIIEEAKKLNKPGADNNGNQ